MFEQIARLVRRGNLELLTQLLLRLSSPSILQRDASRGDARPSPPGIWVAMTNGLVEEKMRDRTAATFRSFPEGETHEEQKSLSDSYKGTAQRSAECVSLHPVVAVRMTSSRLVTKSFNRHNFYLRNRIMSGRRRDRSAVLPHHLTCRLRRKCH